jgi:hypothetical protein
MKKFDKYIVEAKNTHMEHVEDLIFNEGVVGTRKAINFLRDLRDMLAGHSKSSVSRTVKWDGAPAVFAGIDPRDGKFFVAKKGVFNKDPKIYKTPADVKADTSGTLTPKLLSALSEFSKLGIKSGVYQGDLMFTKGDVKKEEIDGDSYFTFQPNTIVYAVPVNSGLGRSISRAKIGVVWHTTYTGNSFDTMSASFGKSIASKFNDVAGVWQTDATFTDESGRATFTEKETEQVTDLLSSVGRIFNNTPAELINYFHENQKLLDLVKIFNNSYVRSGKRINPRMHTQAFMNWITDRYQKEMDKVKTPAGKQKKKAEMKEVMRFFSKFRKAQIQNVWTLMVLLSDAKQLIINKMNQAGSLKTFLRTRSGFKVTAPEGFCAIDHLSNDAVKIVDRMEFSKANFSPDIIKGWQR